MKKRVIVYVLLALFLACLFGYMKFSRGVSRRNYLQIKKEMTREEITDLLGGPGRCSHRIELLNGGSYEWWTGYGGEIRLTYDEHGQIVWKEWKERESENWFSWLLGQRIVE